MANKRKHRTAKERIEHQKAKRQEYFEKSEKQLLKLDKQIDKQELKAMEGIARDAKNHAKKPEYNMDIQHRYLERLLQILNERLARTIGKNDQAA
jgi:hypothetical protein